MSAIANIVSAIPRHLAAWFVWISWKKARPALIELVADFIVSLSVWLAYAVFAALAPHLVTEELVLEVVKAIHACAAVFSFYLLAGAGLVHLIDEIGPGSAKE